MPARVAGQPRRRPPAQRHALRRLVFSKLGALLGAVLTSAVIAAVAYYENGIFGLFRSDPKPYQISTQFDPDEIRTATGPIGGAYVIDAAPEAIRKPPVNVDSCVGRYAWAH